MQPSPSADTSRPWLPSLRVSIGGPSMGWAGVACFAPVDTPKRPPRHAAVASVPTRTVGQRIDCADAAHTRRPARGHMSDQAKTREEQLAAELDEARRRIATLEDSAWRRDFHGTVVDSMQDGLVVLDTDGVHVDANPAFCRMSGFSREELVGTGLPHVYWPPEAQAAIQAAFQRATSHEGQMFELTFMHKSGERFPVLNT